MTSFIGFARPRRVGAPNDRRSRTTRTQHSHRFPLIITTRPRIRFIRVEKTLTQRE